MRAAVKTLMFGGITGKFLGIARELLGAALFGTGPIAVGYRLAQAAFLIPLNGLLSDAFAAGFTPAYARSHEQGDGRSRVLFASMHAAVLGISVIVGLLLVVCAGAWVHLLAPGLDDGTALLTERMLRLLALAMPFYALTGLYASAELALGNARMAAARASMQSTGLIAGTVLAWCSGSALYLAGGFLAAYVLLAAWGYQGVRSRGLRPWPHSDEWAEARSALGLVWSSARVLLLVPVLMQVHFIVERRVASEVSGATVAALDYARFVSDTAVLLLAMPVGLAGLGAMATMSEERFRDAAFRALRALLYAGVPISLALALHGEIIIRLAFARGAFGPDSVTATSLILRSLAVGLWAQLIGYAGAKFLSARDRNVHVILIFLAAFGCNIALNLVLQPVLGAAALGVAAAVNSLVFGFLILRHLDLLRRLRRDLLTVGALSLGYAVVWAAVGMPGEVTPGVATPVAGWSVLLMFAAYWCAMLVIVPRSRELLQQTWLSWRAV